MNKVKFMGGAVAFLNIMVGCGGDSTKGNQSTSISTDSPKLPEGFDLRLC